MRGQSGRQEEGVIQHAQAGARAHGGSEDGAART